jgi:hypothetical protein
MEDEKEAVAEYIELLKEELQATENYLKELEEGAESLSGWRRASNPSAFAVSDQTRGAWRYRQAACNGQPAQGRAQPAIITCA